MMEVDADDAMNVNGVVKNSLWNSSIYNVNRSSPGDLPPQQRQLPSREILETMRAKYSPWATTFDTVTLIAITIAFSLLVSAY